MKKWPWKGMFYLINAAIFVIVAIILLFDLDTKWTSRMDAKNPENHIAVVKTYTNDVKVKAAHSPAFVSGDKGLKIYEHDEVFTPDGATVEIVYQDGHTVYLHENSLVQLKLEGPKKHLDVKAGKVKADGKFTMSINGKHQVHVDGKSELHMGDMNDFHLQVHQGEAKLHHDSGKVMHLQQSHSLKQTGDDLHHHKGVAPH